MKIAAVVALFALMCFAGIAEAQTVQVGDFTAGPNSEGYSLNTGKGERTFIELVSFEKAFSAAPQVVVSVQGFDATSDETNTTRLQVSASKITKSGFTLRVKTWGDGKVNALWGNWVAVGVK